MPEKVTIPKESVAPLGEQASALNWNYGIYDFGKAEQPGFDFFNPGLVERPDGLWLLARRADMGVMNGFGMNHVLALKLDETGTKPQHGKVLEWPGALPGQQFEDARGIYIPGMKQVAVSASTFQWFGEGSNPAWSGAIQVLGFFDADWQCKVLHYPPFDTNGTEMRVVPREAYQKNWIWWQRNDRLHLLYKSDPWTVATFDNHWIDRRMVYVGNPLSWGYGTIRGGTPPVEIDGKLVTFFHSSTPWFERWRRYHVGAIAFNPEPPFHPISMTEKPLISGTTAEHWGSRKPACIFPCGAVKRGERILITAGVNDLKSCWFEFHEQDVMRHLKPIGPEKAIVSAADVPDPKRQAILDRMAKARAARVPGKKHKRGKRMKRSKKRAVTA